MANNFLMLKLKNLMYPVPIKSSLIFLYFIFYGDNFLYNKLFWTILFIWLIFIVACKKLLREIFKHEGLILETRGKDLSMKTRIFKYILTSELLRELFKLKLNYLLKILDLHMLNKPAFFSFQQYLPRLNVPNLNDTIKRYLRSVRPLLTDEAYEIVEKNALEFKGGIGEILHQDVIKKRDENWSESYVSEDWEQIRFLASRSSLMYGTSIYMTDTIYSPTSSQSSRASNLVHIMFKYREDIINQKHEPIRLRGIPICVAAYEKLFDTTRVPGIESDKLIHNKNSQHIAVLHKGLFSKLMVYNEGILLNAAEIQMQIEEILHAAVEISRPENFIASLTSLNRAEWGRIRKEYFSFGVNKRSLDQIENAAFVLALDEECYNFDLSSSSLEYGNYGKQLLVGNGFNRYAEHPC